jgi:hypothetical protein
MRKTKHIEQVSLTAYLTRKQTSELLGCSYTRCMRLEAAGYLIPINANDADDTTRRRYGSGRQPTVVYRSADVMRVLEHAEFAPSTHGYIAARAFALFREDKPPADIVVTLKVSPEHARKLHSEFLSMTEQLVIPARILADLKILGFGEVTAENLVATLDRVLRRARVAAAQKPKALSEDL